MQTKTITQTITFPASPREVYDALLDSKKHSAIIGDKAVVSNKLNGKFSVWSDFITGRNTKLVKDKKIVQSWNADMEDWPKTHDSIVTFEFQKTKTGTRLVFTHHNIPSRCVASISKGWTDYYWKPMKKYFETAKY